MTASKFRDWLEIVGLFSVVASLVFVGLQMKQSQDIAIANQYQERANNQLELLRTKMETGRSIASFMAGSPSAIPESPSPEDFDYLVNWVLYQWYTLDNNHYQYQAGFLPEDHWRGQEESLKQILTVCEIRWIWTTWRSQYARRGFVEYVDSLGNSCPPEYDLRPWDRDSSVAGEYSGRQ